MTSFHAAIVGAGPYGLSIAAHLRAAGVSFQVLGQPMHTWASCMPEGMVLRSEPFASSLWDPGRRHTFERFCAQDKTPYTAIGMPPTCTRFLEYARWFQQQSIGDVSGDMVRTVRRDGRGFSLTLASGDEMSAANVILATGFMSFRRVAAELAGLPAPLCVHSSMMDDVASYAGRDVAVVGAGQSALEYAALLHEGGAKVRLLARTSALKWNGGPKPDRTWIDGIMKPYAGLGAGWKDLAISECPQLFRAMFEADKRHRYVATSWGPSGAWWLRQRVENKIETLLGSELRGSRVDGGKAVLELRRNGTTSELAFDRVISATGFKVDLARLGYLDASLASEIEREGDAPRLDASYQTSVPGLFVVGAASAPTFGPVMRFMFGAKHAAPTVARRLRRGAGRD